MVCELWLEIKSPKDESPRKDFEILKGKGKGTIGYIGSKEIMRSEEIDASDYTNI